MLGRFVTFLFILLLGWLIGVLAADPAFRIQGGAWGLLAGALLWFFVDLWRGMKVTNWLTSPDASLPTTWGVWGEVVDRVRRLTRLKDRQIHTHQASLAQFLSAIQASPNGVLMLDHQWRITWCNTMSAQHLGIDPARDMAQLIGNLVRNPDFSQYLQQSDHSQPVIIEGRDHRPDLPQRLALQLFPYGQGQHLLLSQDITAVEQSEAMRRDFVANISHELKTPIGGISILAEAIAEGSENPELVKNFAERMNIEAGRLTHLVQEIIDLSRIQDQNPMENAAEISLNKVIDEAIYQSKIRAEKRQVQINFSNEEEVLFSGDRKQLVMAISNLIENAINYSPEQTTVNVVLRKVNDVAEISVSDQGVGIAEQDLERIFERFYRVDQARSRETGGTGLGLSIVKHVISNHGGDIQVWSVPGTGSTFTVLLPLTNKAAESEDK